MVADSSGGWLVRWSWVLVVVGVAAAVGGLLVLRSMGGDTFYCGGYELPLEPSTDTGPSCEDQLNAFERSWWTGVALIVGGIAVAAFALGVQLGVRLPRGGSVADVVAP